MDHERETTTATTATPPAEKPARGKKLAFVATEDWFFASHFLPMARAGVEAGFEVVVIARVRAHADIIAATGARVVPLEAERRSFNPFAILTAMRDATAILRREKPDIVHSIALRAILVGGVAARLAGVRRRVHAVTGLGFLGARQDAAGRIARAFVRFVLRGPLDGPGTRFLFENRDDPRFLNLAPDDPEVTIVGGAGVDPDRFRPEPLPSMPPLKVAVVARMLWSKGIDLAVEAVQRAQARGAAIELTLVGAPDADNPKAVPEATLRAWSGEPGIHWAGPTGDVGAVWRTHHVACLPSRGGEGLPRTILEAGACGRAIVTTDVPGCRDFVRDGVEGLVVPPNDAEALAGALQALADDRARVSGMGEAARARFLGNYTERHVMDEVIALWRGLLAQEPRPRR